MSAPPPRLGKFAPIKAGGKPAPKPGKSPAKPPMKPAARKGK